jgi:hypothetical protein
VVEWTPRTLARTGRATVAIPVDPPPLGPPISRPQVLQDVRSVRVASGQNAITGRPSGMRGDAAGTGRSRRSGCLRSAREALTPVGERLELKFARRGECGVEELERVLAIARFVAPNERLRVFVLGVGDP